MSVDALFAGPWGPLLIFALRIVDVSMATVRMLLAHGQIEPAERLL